MVEIPDPTSEIVQSRLEEWDDLGKYVLQESCLNLLFQELLPGNEDVGHILIKVSALNDFYSTNIYDTHAVAKHIASLNIAKKLAHGDLGLVNRIAPIEVGGKFRRFYSFASKYCSHHHPEMYPIYDQYVEKVLLYFRKKSRFSKFKNADLKDYENFVAVIKEFSKAFKLEKFSLKQIDVYLWLTGKENFNAYKA
jgi:hypothetical protein